MLCKGLASYMKAEQDMFVILGKCQKEVIRWEKIFFQSFQSWTHQKRNIIDKVDCKMTRAVEKIDWVRDESIVVERLKTGELPPADVQVDESPGNSFALFFSNFSFKTCLT